MHNLTHSNTENTFIQQYSMLFSSLCIFYALFPSACLFIDYDRKLNSYEILFYYTLLLGTSVHQRHFGYGISSRVGQNYLANLRTQKKSLYSTLFHIWALQSTLTCQIIVQDHLIVQVADFSEINKRVGLSKAVQEGFFFLIYIGENQVLKEKSQKLVNVQVLIRLCRCFFPRKITRFAAQLFGRSE